MRNKGKSSLVALLGIIFLVFFWFYLGYHAIYGPRGYRAWIKEEKILKERSSQYKYLELQQSHLHNEVEIFQKNIDGDRLEQYAWTLFRQVNPAMKVVYLPDS